MQTKPRSMRLYRLNVVPVGSDAACCHTPPIPSQCPCYNRTAGPGAEDASRTYMTEGVTAVSKRLLSLFFLSTHQIVAGAWFVQRS